MCGWVCRRELTFRPCECRHLGAELLGRPLGPLRPGGTPVRQLRAAPPGAGGGVPEGQDVLDEEGSERLDGVRHLRRSAPQTEGLSRADSWCRGRGWSAVSPRKLVRCHFIRGAGGGGRDGASLTAEGRGRACHTDTHAADAFSPQAYMD